MGTDPAVFTNSGRAVGAELIRQLSTLKLEYCHSPSPSPIVKRQQAESHGNEGHQAGRNNPRTIVSSSSAAVRPKLLRQSTTNAEAIPNSSGSGKRQRLAHSGQNWRSCDVPVGHGRRNSNSRTAGATGSGQRPLGASSTGSIALNPMDSTVIVPITHRASPTSSNFRTEVSPRLSHHQPSPVRDEDRCVRYEKEGDQIMLPPASLVQGTCSTKKLLTPKNGSPDPRASLSSTTSRSRRIRGIIILTSVVLVFTCVFLVGFTLRLAPLIDELGKMSDEPHLSCCSFPQVSIHPAGPHCWLMMKMRTEGDVFLFVVPWLL